MRGEGGVSKMGATVIDLAETSTGVWVESSDQSKPGKLVSCEFWS